MFIPEEEAGDTELNKKHIQNRIQFDGRLIAPIDLTLEDAFKIKLDPLGWNNLENPPTKMKISNTGETVIVSGKWGKDRPYITGGPLVDKYVFSQLHFHWGEHEHEGSEHTVRGIAYPMEMHVVLFKTRYLTQEAALKHEDGVVIINYLVKLGNKSSPTLQWLGSNLEKIIQPKSHSMLEPTPLSSILVPMTKDYLIYWGALVTDHCSHTVMWIVSRAALGITVDDLKKFRQLQNTRSSPMIKNFREATSQQGRIIFHANPSEESGNLLLPGTIEPPGKALTVNYSHMPELDPRQALSIFKSGIGDCSEKVEDKLEDDASEDKSCNETKSITKDPGLHNETNKTKKNNGSIIDSGTTENLGKRRVTSRSPQNRLRLLRRNTAKDQDKNIEHEKENSKNHDKECLSTCISKVSMSVESSDPVPSLKENLPDMPNSGPKSMVKSLNKKSLLPILTHKKPLQSTLVEYFKTGSSNEKPVQKETNKPSTPKPKASPVVSQNEKRIPKVINKPPTPKPKSRPIVSPNEKPVQKVMSKPPTPKPRSRPLVTSIPKPIGINAGKLNSSKVGTN